MCDQPLLWQNSIHPNDLPRVEEVIRDSVSGKPFRIEYRADDSLMRHGLNIDARISFGGRVRFRTGNAHVLTLGNATFPHEVWVEPAAR